MKAFANRRGISTMETLGSLTVMAIVMAGLALTTVRATRQNDSSKIEAQASALVQDKMEQLRALDPGSSPADLTAGTHVDPRNPLGADPSTAGRFTRTWTVQRDTPLRGLAQVNIVVSTTGHNPISVSGVSFLCTTRTCS